jgi:hypothetical protein
MREFAKNYFVAVRAALDSRNIHICDAALAEAQ